MHLARLCYVTIDCNDLDRSFRFWTQALSAQNQPFGDDRDKTYRRMNVPNSDLGIVLQQVPETKSAKTPVHLCIESNDVRAEAQRLIDLGAAVVDQRDEFDLPLRVLADPFGNEFCVISAAYPDTLEQAGSRY